MFVSEQTEVTGVSATIFFDRSKPQGPIKINNFPQQVLMHRVGRGLDQFGAIVKDVDLHSGRQAAGRAVELFDLLLEQRQRRQRLGAFAQ